MSSPLFFFKKVGFGISCKLETIRIKRQTLFSGKNKKKYFKVSSARLSCIAAKSHPKNKGFGEIFSWRQPRLTYVSPAVNFGPTCPTRKQNQNQQHTDQDCARKQHSDQALEPKIDGLDGRDHAIKHESEHEHADNHV